MKLPEVGTLIFRNNKADVVVTDTSRISEQLIKVYQFSDGSYHWSNIFECLRMNKHPEQYGHKDKPYFWEGI